MYRLSRNKNERHWATIVVFICNSLLSEVGDKTSCTRKWCFVGVGVYADVVQNKKTYHCFMTEYSVSLLVHSYQELFRFAVIQEPLEDFV